MFKIVKVDSSCAESLEQLGTKRKFWFTDDSDDWILFKADKRGTGEDWSEKLACELCRLLSLPHVHYEMAQDIYKNNPGVICRNIAPAPVSLEHGNELLLARDSNYPAQEENKYKVRQHTVGTVSEVMQILELPPGQFCTKLPENITTALDVFIGYVMLDALIGNQDRHHQNWAALLIGSKRYLAPTFDHAAGMARHLQDTERKARLTT